MHKFGVAYIYDIIKMIGPRRLHVGPQPLKTSTLILENYKKKIKIQTLYFMKRHLDNQIFSTEIYKRSAQRSHVNPWLRYVQIFVVRYKSPAQKHPDFT
jgi:hypothetical protein